MINRLRFLFLANPGFAKQCCVATAICFGLWAVVALLAGHQRLFWGLLSLALLWLWLPPLLASLRRSQLSLRVVQEKQYGRSWTHPRAAATNQQLTELQELEEMWKAPTTTEPSSTQQP